MGNSPLCFCAFVKGKVDSLFSVKGVWQAIDQQGAFSPSVMSKSTCSTNAQQLCIDDASWPWGLSPFANGRDLIIRHWVPTGPFKVPAGPPVACAAIHLPVSDTSSYSFSADPSLPYVASFSDPPGHHSNNNLSYGAGRTLPGLQSLMRLAYPPTRLWASWKKRLGIINHFFYFLQYA